MISTVAEKKKFSDHVSTDRWDRTFFISAIVVATIAGEWFHMIAAIPGGGALGYFLGGYVPPESPNWHPVLKKKFP